MKAREASERLPIRAAVDHERRQAIASLRAHFAAFGVDVSDLSDEEIEERVAQMSRVFAQAGTSTKDALRALEALGTMPW